MTATVMYLRALCLLLILVAPSLLAQGPTPNVNDGNALQRECGAALEAAAEDIGFYRAYSGDTLLGSIPVNVDNRESNLASLEIDQLEELAQRSRDRFFAESGGDPAALRRLREGRPLWYSFLLAALGFLAVEQMLAMAWKT